MKSCKECIYSRPIKQFGLTDWYCTFKEDWIVWQIQAMLCRNYM